MQEQRKITLQFVEGLKGYEKTGLWANLWFTQKKCRQSLALTKHEAKELVKVLTKSLDR